MKYLYLWINIGSFIIPFLFSFHPKLKFYKKWPALAMGLLLMMAVFIPWDIMFTNQGFWGFNPDYLSGYYLLGLPLEEWLFFICIPYACIFTHYALLKLFPGFVFSKRVASVAYVSLLCLLIVVLWYYYDRWYTLVNFTYALLILGVVFNRSRRLLRSYFATYLVILLPFFIVNGLLTGTGIPEQVVWYNNSENLGLRILTIPAEDLIYNLSMLLTVLFVMEIAQNRLKKNQPDS